MPGIRIDKFGGIIPKLSKQLLDSASAQTAENCRLAAGRLEPWYEKSEVEDASVVAGTDSLYLWRYTIDDTSVDVTHEKWLSWTSDVDVVRGPIANDQYNRIYYTKNGVLRCRRYAKNGRTVPPPYQLERDDDRPVGLPKPSKPTFTSAWRFDPAGVFTAKTRIHIYYSGWSGGPGGQYIDVVGKPTEHEFDELGNLILTFAFPGTQFAHFSLTGQVTSWGFYTNHQLTLWASHPTYTVSLPSVMGGVLGETAETAIRTDPSDDESEQYATLSVASATDSGLGMNWRNTDASHTTWPPVTYFRPETSAFTCKFKVNMRYAQGTKIYAVYCQTFADDMGAEGPPSDPSDQITIEPGKKVTLTMPSQLATTPAYVWHRRLYRSAQGDTTGAEYYFVDEIDSKAGALATYLDNKRDADLGEIMPRFENPPGYDDPNLSGDDDPNADLACNGLVVMAGGFLAAFDGSDIYFSDAYLPYSWPTKYRMAIDFDVVGLAAIGNDLLVMTEGHPYLISGSHPEMLTQTKLNVNQSCVSKRGICRATGSILYPSPDGLIAMSAGGHATIATEQFFSRREWQEIDPASMIAVSHDDKVFAFTSVGGYVFAFGAGGQTVTTLDETPGALYSDLEGDNLYLCLDKGAESVLYLWEGDTENPKTLKWRSKQFTYPRTITFKVVRIRADDYPVTLRLYAGGAEEATYEVDILDARPVRLPVPVAPAVDAPALDTNREWEYEVESDFAIDEILLEERSINDITERAIKIRKTGDVFTWLGKEFRLPSRSAFTCARIDAEAYPVTLKVYVQSELKYTRVVSDDRPIRLPVLPNERLWEIDAILDTTPEEEEPTEELDIFEVALGTSMKALR